MDKQVVDYIVVGAGSAGCVIAHRLIKAGHSVLLLEAGPTDAVKFVKMPATFVRVIGTERSWVYETTPQPHANGRKMYVPQGRMTESGTQRNEVPVQHFRLASRLHACGVEEAVRRPRQLRCTGHQCDDPGGHGRIHSPGRRRGGDSRCREFGRGEVGRSAGRAVQ